jgi:pimeloyl-ACP methyl ester carboxylesterase
LPRRGKELVMPNPAIVLVHGAFADASSWRPVFDRLASDGHTVLAPPNPLRGIPYDASFTASVIDQLDGPGCPSAAGRLRRRLHRH